MIDFIDKYDIPYKYQFDFRKSHSTQQALICLIYKISKAIDKGRNNIRLFRSKKAFDTGKRSPSLFAPRAGLMLDNIIRDKEGYLSTSIFLFKVPEKAFHERFTSKCIEMH